jgi:type I restriction enzyme S subunit
MLSVPSFEEQHRISHFLDRETAKIDALIEKKERLIELLQEKRKALITQAVTKGLDPTVPMKDSGIEWLGKIPTHWSIKSNRRLFEDSDIRSDFGDEELLTVSHLSGVTRHSEKNVTMIEPESYEDYKICRAGELAINTMWAWMGALGVAKENGIVSPSYNVYALKTSSLDPRYYDYLCRTPLHIAELTRYSKGIWKSRLRLYPDGFYEISTPLPPITEQEQIADFVDSAVLKVDVMLMATRKAVDRLREYRTALISAAVTGKIDVREG